MSTEFIDSSFGRAAGFSRRGSLLSLGVVGIAALTGSVTAEARKKSGKKDRKKRKQEEDRCPAQVEPCSAFITALCAGDEECLGQTTCCAFLERCNITTFLTCVSGAAN